MKTDAIMTSYPYPGCELSVMQPVSTCCSRAATCAARLCWRRRFIFSTSSTHLEAFPSVAQTSGQANNLRNLQQARMRSLCHTHRHKRRCNLDLDFIPRPPIPGSRLRQSYQLKVGIRLASTLTTHAVDLWGIIKIRAHPESTNLHQPGRHLEFCRKSYFMPTSGSRISQLHLVSWCSLHFSKYGRAKARLTGRLSVRRFWPWRVTLTSQMLIVKTGLYFTRNQNERYERTNQQTRVIAW